MSTVCCNLFEACSVLFRSLFGVRCLTFSQLRRMHHVNLADMLFDAILDGMEDWYGKECTREQMGFNDAVYNYVLTVPGL